jgi:serine/threonine protein kinase
MIGKTVSRYSILEKLGEGGMGVVYLAEDTRLHRRVALKFLPRHFTSDADARERFEREARAAAALNHPNIVTVYDIGEAEEHVFMAMELVEGETLDDRIAGAASGRPMATGEIRDIVAQISEGLGKAHEAGIIHRDMKPSNIMIDGDGRVKILDFGLAKLKGSSKLTKEASTLGTVQYMSPEQARGEDVDRRSDIWSIGAVLYEMLTARQPFRGDYDQHVIYSILHDEPEPPGLFRDDVPPELERIVRKAMRKDRNERYQDTDAILSDLRAGDRMALAGRGSKGSVIMKWAFAAVAVIAAALVITRYIPGDDARRSSGPVSRQITFTGSAIEPSISPDGNYIAYMTGTGSPGGAIFVKDIESGSKVGIHSTTRGFNIKWSPDGSRLLYAEIDSGLEGGVYLLPRLGGAPRKLLEHPWYFLSWAPDGARFAFSRVGSGDLHVLDVDSGDTTSVDIGGEIGEIEEVDWSPSGEDILLQVNDHEKIKLLAIRSDGSDARRLFEIDQAGDTFIGNPRWSRDGNAVYFLETGIRGQFISDLMKVKYDKDERRLDGEPRALLSNLSAVKNPGIGTAYSISADGRRLVYEQRSGRMDLWLVRAKGEGERTRWTKRRLTNSTMLKTRPKISPDGSEVTFGMGNERSFDIYTLVLPESMDEPLNEPVRLTYLESNSDLPAYSPDGKEIAFMSMSGGVMKVWHIDREGGTPRPYPSSRGSIMDQELEWAPGPGIIYRAGNINNYRVLDPETGEESDLIKAETDGYTFVPHWSNAGDRVALFMNMLEGGEERMTLLVMPYPDGECSPVADKLFFPRGWSADDKWIYALELPEDWTDSSNTVVSRIDPFGGRIEQHAKVDFAPNNVRGLVITPDGRTIVLLQIETTSDIWLVEDFDPDID